MYKTQAGILASGKTAYGKEMEMQMHPQKDSTSSLLLQ